MAKPKLSKVKVDRNYGHSEPDLSDLLKWREADRQFDQIWMNGEWFSKDVLIENAKAEMKAIEQEYLETGNLQKRIDDHKFVAQICQQILIAQNDMTVERDRPKAKKEEGKIHRYDY